jgi:bifunctional pyridoxal-dependent enzyme with beta-cystathionase and maltose regulon repressor activities
MFLWIDLRRYLGAARTRGNVNSKAVDSGGATRETLLEREAFIEEMFMKNGVSISRGSIFFTEEIGWFRITFTLPREPLLEGIDRMLKALSEVERKGWH